ncbi:MAG TPA: sulfotransferase [Candidatus Acidoferrum sp.]|nr:sulfotransferase [Candidatus Acidoferrum sp.]
MATQSLGLTHPRPGSFQEAAEAWKRQDYQKTIELLTRASQAQPANSKLLLNLGEAYGLRFEYQEAERCLEKAVTVTSNKVETLAQAGRRCQRFGQPGMGNRYFTRAAEHPDVSAWVLVALAEFEEGHSRAQAALAWLARALGLKPGYPRALLVRARLHRASGELEEGERLLRSLLARPEDEVTAPAWYELGTNLDRQSSYEQAMEAFLQAKALIRPACTAYVAEFKKLHAKIRTVEETVSASTLERWLAVSAELQPSRRFALLCGHPRSGTTLLEQVLDAHPGIVATAETSILMEEAYSSLSRGFPEDAPILRILEAASINTLQQARADYFRFTESFSGRAIGHKLLIDKSPGMDADIPVVARIFPEAALLVAIRDPRDVCLSCFMLPLPPGRMSALCLSLEGTAAQYASLMGFSRAIRSRLPSPQMEVRYEDVVGDLEGVSRRVLGFLGLEWNPSVLRFDDHAKTKLLRCAIDEAVAKPIFKSSVGRWRHYQKYLEPCLEQLEPFIKAFGYD